MRTHQSPPVAGGSTVGLPGVRPFTPGAVPDGRRGVAGPGSGTVGGRAARGFAADTGPAVRDALRSAGRPLAEPVRSEMERRLGADFADVRVHTGTAAHAAARAVQARAFTCGAHVIFGHGGYDGASAAGRAVLAHELAHVLQQRRGPVAGTTAGDRLALSDPGDRFERAAEAISRRAMAGPTESGAVPVRPAAGGPATGGGQLAVQRWYQLAETSAGVPNPRLGPNGNQVTTLRWFENNKPPKGAYRFELDGEEWQSPGGKTAFTKITGSKEEVDAKPEATSWYDITKGAWAKGQPPDNYRKALDAERPREVTGLKRHGFGSVSEVPMFKKMRFRPKSGSKKSKRPASARARDRVAREMLRALPETSTPHLAVAMTDDRLVVAGNTGPRHVTPAQQEAADERLAAALDPQKDPASTYPRQKKDIRKLRALGTGDYAAHHAQDRADLEKIDTAVRQPAQWRNVRSGDSGKASVHGEMTLLGELVAEMRRNPGDPAKPAYVALGGNLLSCAICWAAVEIVNKMIAAPLGYRVRVSGTHHKIYENWTMPDFIYRDSGVRAALSRELPTGWAFVDGVLKDYSSVGGSAATESGLQPDESDSDWEEVLD